jgi:23S rRNA (uracil1939-C5)-methyltransferase
LPLSIEKLVYGGDGLARLPADEHGRGKALFVPFVLEGEEVAVAVTEQKPGFARGRAEQILKASPFRVAPGCPYFQLCGGCHYQHAAYSHQLTIKTAILKENLRRIAKLELESEIHVHPSPEWNYRNRARLKVRTAPDFALGYFKFNSHELLPVEQCPISSPLINRAIAVLWQAYGGEAPSPDLDGIQEIEFFANSDDTQLQVEAYCGPDVSPSVAAEQAKELKALLSEVSGVAVFRNEVRSPETIAGAGTPQLTYVTQHASYRVSAGSFFQVNRHLTDELVTLVTAGRSGRTALDLYAGVGLFSSVLSREFERVIAVESSPLSYADLRYNAPGNVKAVQAMSEQYLKNVSGKLQPDLVVVDPPRNGLGERVVHALVSLGAPRMTYVSCDPATLSRDLGRLLNYGYRVEQAHLVDLFPQTYHLESVFHLVR